MGGDAKDTLSDKQMLAVGLLVQGLSDGDVAEKVGVTRETVNRWRNGDDGFLVALNAERARVWQDAHDRLRALVGDAVTVLEGSVRSADADHKVAIAILRAVGVYGVVGRPGGAVTLEALENERRRDEMRRLLDSVV